MNNHSDTQTSSTHGYTINNTSNNQEHTGIIEKTPTNGHIDKTDENINTWTPYGRISRKLDRLAYHLIRHKH